MIGAWPHIKDLDDLKSQLIGVVVAISAVIFAGVVVDASPGAVPGLLCLQYQEGISLDVGLLQGIHAAIACLGAAPSVS